MRHAELPNQMWGTDATATFTEADGTVTVFAAIDHCTAECIGLHAVKKATRFEAYTVDRGLMRTLRNWTPDPLKGFCKAT